jgi:hypothetical protein
MASKKIQISSSFNIESESLHQTVRNNHTGETKVADIQEPYKRTEKTTITTNPVKYETNGTEEPRVTEGEVVEINPATVGYDTSQL